MESVLLLNEGFHLCLSFHGKVALHTKLKYTSHIYLNAILTLYTSRQ